jgi:hypothetical protein
MDLQEFLAFDHAEMISPIGLSFGMRGRGADLFLLEIIGDKDSPIRFEGRMIAFGDEALCRAALERLKILLPVGVKVEHEYRVICDIRSAVEMVIEQEQDPNAVVLKCINTLLDLIETGSFDPPDEYAILRALADRLTFSAEFKEFVQTRSLIRTALLWCAGVTSVDLRLIQSLPEFESVLPGLCANPHR